MPHAPPSSSLPFPAKSIQFQPKHSSGRRNLYPGRCDHLKARPAQFGTAVCSRGLSFRCASDWGIQAFPSPTSLIFQPVTSDTRPANSESIRTI